MKFLPSLLLLATLLFGSQFSSKAQVYKWAKLMRQLGPSVTPSEYAGTGGTDAAGNTYTTVGFRDSIRVGNQSFGAANGNLVLVKYDSTGQVRWAKQLRNLAIAAQGIAVSPTSGEVFVHADAQAGATWGGSPIGTGNPPAFFAKLTATGALDWVQALPAFNNKPGYELERGFTADDLGNCYLMGTVRLPSTIGGVALDSTVTFLLKATNTGATTWVRQFQTRYPSPNRNIRAISTLALGPKPGGGCVLLGLGGNPNPAGTVYYGATPTVAISPADGYTFTANIDAAGNLLWVRRPQFSAQNPMPGNPYAVTGDAAGNCYSTGMFGNAGLGVVKYDAAGVVQWTRFTSSPGFGFNSAGTHVVVDGAGNVTVLCTADADTGNGLTPPSILGALTFRSLLNVVRFSPSGQEQWAVGDKVGPLIRYGRENVPAYALNGAGSLGVDVRGNLYYTASVLVLDSFLIRGGHPAVQVGAHTLTSKGVAIMRIGTRHNLLKGRVYLDANANGQPDAGEGAFPAPVVLQATQPTLTTLGTAEANSRFTMHPDSGAYQMSIPNLPRHYTLTQPASATYSGRLAGYGRTDSLRNFGIAPTPNQADVRVTLTPYGAARPGFVTRYRLTVENVGTTTIASNTATATLDSRLAYVSSTPAGSRSGQTVTWTYTNLAPFGRREFDVLFSLPINTALGTQLSSTATAPLTADVTPDDNSTTALQTVTGSFDPNDIEVNYQRLTPAQVAARQPLDYTIRFQNMGTDTAFTVVLSDTLDFRKLDVASLYLVAQSHNCIWELSGAGLLTVRFLNIDLPHRNQDVIRSQGFVRFRVQPRTTVGVGEVIPNHARIYFDYNDPVRTNTATTTVLLPTATLARHTAAAWEAYPNPATDALTVAAELATAGPVRVELLDLLGRPVRQQTLVAPAGPLRLTLDLRGLAAGVYVLRVAPPGGPSTSRQIMHE